MASLGAGKVTIFYNLFGGLFGDTESFYLQTLPPEGIFQVGGVVDQYLLARLACSTPDIQAVYARRTIPGSPFQVDFFDLTTRQYFGTQKGTSIEPQMALLCRGRMNIGRGIKMFMRCIPESQVQGRQIVLSGKSWINAFNAFASFLTTNTTIGFLNTVVQDITNRNYVASVSALAHRGFQITASSTVGGLAVGSIISFGGQGNSAVGLNGRKVVTSVIATNPAAVFDVGGARPVIAGTGPVAGQSYFYLKDPQLGSATTFDPERLTRRKIGLPFEPPHGRNRNLLSLRQ